MDSVKSRESVEIAGFSLARDIGKISRKTTRLSMFQYENNDTDSSESAAFFELQFRFRMKHMHFNGSMTSFDK